MAYAIPTHIGIANATLLWQQAMFRPSGDSAMSVKFLIIAAAIGSGAWALTRHAPPVPADATAADSVSLAGIGARLHYGVGMVGSKLVGSTVRSSAYDTQQALKDLKPAIKATRGGNGTRAKNYAAKVVALDSMALLHLEYGRPIKAIQATMEATSMLGAVRGQIKTGI
jgi:hypothetical protein